MGERREPNLRAPGEPASLLGALQGALPAAPTWFQWALSQEPQRSAVEVRGASIELLAWGQRSQPGLLFLHGTAAHADVWRFIAPFFTETHRAGALSWSGMGRSDWRPSYSLDDEVEEIVVAAETLGLFEGGQKPVLVSHSAGSVPAIVAAQCHGDRFGGLVVVDAPFRRIDVALERPGRPRGQRRYPTLEAALERFSLQPLQTCENLFAVDRIARDSLVHDNGSWRWRFDPHRWSRPRCNRHWDAFAAPRCPLAVVLGELSPVTAPEIVANMRAQAPSGTPFISIPNANHQVMADEPIAFVSALRSIIGMWSSLNA